MTMTNLALCHGGDQGDMVYSLAAVKAIVHRTGRQADYNVYPRFDVRVRQTPDTVRNIAPLLEAQPYVGKVTFTPLPEGIPLDRWRTWYRDPTFNIAAAHLQDYRLPRRFMNEPWLTVPSPRKVARVVFARSARYHGPKFLWPAFIKRHAGEAVFLGTMQEHDDFETAFDTKIHRVPTPHVLQLAEVIAGAELFVGNQSLPYAIAEGLKMDSCQETTPRECNCIFPRPNATFSETGHG